MSDQQPGGQRDPSLEDDESESQRLTLTRSISGGVNVAESIVYQDTLPEDEITERGKAIIAASSISWIPVKYLVLLCGFLTSLSFSVTQVPLYLVFRLMTCEGYYKAHPEQREDVRLFQRLIAVILPRDPVQVASSSFYRVVEIHDHCAIPAIDTSTALSISLLGASTTIFGIVNLFFTGSLIKRIGVQRTLIMQIFFPAVRLLVQNIGVDVGGYTGILIIQCSQLVNIVGGPSGYVLALNQFITDIVSHEERTASLGKMAGTTLFGSAFGFLAGGLIAEAFGIKIPFRVTLVLFSISTAFVVLFLPYVPPASAVTDTAESGDPAAPIDNVAVKSKPMSQVLGPLLVFRPRKFVLQNGDVRTEYGALLVACGVFIGIVATGYIPNILQLFSTDVFQFGAKQNGWLIFTYSLLRGCFLAFAFPRIIASGRKIVAERANRHSQARQSQSGETQPLLDAQRSDDLAANNKGAGNANVYAFDLTYTRFSIVADSILTFFCTFLRDGWQMYLVAAILPFAAGTGSAAKGTVLEIVGGSASSDERTDALAGISLVENMARLATTFLFGVIFAAFTSIGRPELTFTVNAACALLAFAVLLFARFPPDGSVRVDDVDTLKAPTIHSSDA